ncbi:hypothetical protein Nepgr_028327 [Nepenthes gracilis]|uniref:Uncharacterized protein n=1 Tax=Nepenthes gracilis TaxID=150966 RepID=A0AAD3TC11_NEPGR|nr:hypothetical protein Nepgr_028327 [Nepenthes gracilis]
MEQRPSFRVLHASASDLVASHSSKQIENSVKARHLFQERIPSNSAKVTKPINSPIPVCCTIESIRAFWHCAAYGPNCHFGIRLHIVRFGAIGRLFPANVAYLLGMDDDYTLTGLVLLLVLCHADVAHLPSIDKLCA